MALKGPSLFCLSPETIARNITGVVERFADDGLTRKEYVHSALKQPSLFYQSPETIARNITGVVERFADDGLAQKDYLKAALKQPPLFYQSPDTIAANITGVVDHFAGDGLTRKDYLKAVLKQPQLFCQTPDTIAANLTGVVERFASDGLTREDYLRGALKQPSLFTQLPETIIRHIDTVQDFADRGLFTPPLPRRKHQQQAPSPGNNSHAAVIGFLLANPKLLCLADDNFGLREVHQRLTDGPTHWPMLRNARHVVEREMMQHLGHAGPHQSVPNDGFIAGAAPPTEEQAKRFLLRALIHASFIRGGSMDR